jgi:uncharacterized membrane protein YhaH (DUF805 family)
MNGRARRSDFGAVILGAIIVFVGGYYLLRNTLGWDLGELDWEPIWPILVIVLGAAILYGALTRSRHEEGPRTQ